MKVLGLTSWQGVVTLIMLSGSLPWNHDGSLAQTLARGAKGGGGWVWAHLVEEPVVLLGQDDERGWIHHQQPVALLLRTHNAPFQSLRPSEP